MSQDSVLTTLIFNARRDGAELLSKRENRIREAVAFPSGTLENRLRTVVQTLPNGKIAYFEKPGKEAGREKPNVFDMYPNVGTDSVEYFGGWTFDMIWEYLIKISIVQQAAFRKILVLLYRLCYLYDHSSEDGKIRYQPNDSILACINCIENYVLKDGFKEKFGTTEVDLLDFLYFVDLLAWNEDVKYHPPVNGGKLFAQANRRNIGRINTILSLVGAPLLIAKFIRDVITKTEDKGYIDVKLITKTIQKFTKSRGLCIPTQGDLLKDLVPFLKETAK